MPFLFLLMFSIVISVYYNYTHKIVDEQLRESQILELRAMQTSIQNNMQVAASPLLIFNRSETAKQILIKDDDSKREIF